MANQESRETSGVEPWKPRRRRRLLRGLAIVLLLPVVLAGAALAYLSTEAGGRHAGRVVSGLAGDTMALDSVRLDPTGGLALRGLELRDADGAWAAIDRVDAIWSWAPLLGRTVAIDRVAVGTVRLDRTPVDTEAPADDGPPDEAPFALPELPVSVDLGALTVERLVLAEAVAGVSAAFGARGSAAVDRAGALSLDLAVDRLDGPVARLALMAAADLRARRLDVDLSMEEAPGGLVATLSGQPDLPGLTLNLTGDGDLDGWNGRLAAAAGTAGIDADVTLAGGESWRLAVTGAARPGGFVPPDLGALVGETLDLDLVASYAPNGRVEVERFGVAVAVATLGGGGRVDPNGTLSGTVDVVVAPNDALAALTAPAVLGPGRIELAVSGSVAAPIVRASGWLDRVATPDATLAPVPVDLELSTSMPYETIHYALSSAGIGLALADPGLADLAGDRLDLSVGGIVDLAAGFVRADVIDVAAGPLAVFGNGSAEFVGAAEAVLTVTHWELGRLSALAGLPLDGAAELRMIAALDPARGIDATVDLAATDLAAGAPELAALVGRSPSLFAQAAVDPTFARISLASLSAEIAVGRLEAAGIVDLAEERLALDWTVAADRLDLASAVAGTPVSGRVTAEGRAAGALADPDVTLSARSTRLGIGEEVLENLSLDLAARTVASAPRAELRLTAATGYGPLAATGTATRAGEVIELRDLVVTRGETDRITADVDLTPSGPVAKGRLSFDLDDLGSFEAFVDDALAGRISGSIDLDAPAGEQRAAIDIRGEGLSLGRGEAAVGLAGVLVTGSARDLLGDPTLALAVEASDFAAAPAMLDTLRVSLDGPLTRLGVTLSVEGTVVEPVRAELLAVLALDDAEQSITLDRLSAAWGALDAALVAPVTARRAGGDLTLSPLDLDVAGGSLRMVGEKRGRAVDGDLSLEGVAIGRLAALVPEAEVDFEGRVGFDARLTGTVDTPTLEARLEARDIKGRTRDLARLPPLTLVADLRVADAEATLVAEASGVTVKPLRIDANVPVTLTLEPFAAAVAPDAPLSGKFAWAGSIGNVLRYLPVDSVLIDGTIDAAFDVAGTVERPDVSGRLGVADGRYENRTIGTVLDPFTFDVTGAGEALEIAFEARTPAPTVSTANILGQSISTQGLIGGLATEEVGAGAMSLAGTVDLAGADGPDLSLRLTARDAVLVARDDVTASIGADITVAGTPAGMAVAGRVEPSFVEVRLIDALPPSVTELEVVEAGAPPPEPDDGPSPADAITLDLAIDMPRRIFVRGRGLDSEWGGGFRITGTAADPVIDGAIGPIRGNFNFAGKRFDLSQSTVGFSPGSVEPILDIAAVSEADDITAIVRVRGTPSAPEITFESDPPLPDDEVLSRILFGKSSGQLTAAESLQLAQALAELSSGEAGVLDVARDTLGLDELSFGAGEGGGIGTVRAGRYLAKNVFVGVEQGASAASTRATVEVDVTDTIKLQSSVGSDSRSRVGVEWELDY